MILNMSTAYAYVGSDKHTYALLHVTVCATWGIRIIHPYREKVLKG